MPKTKSDQNADSTPWVQKGVAGFKLGNPGRPVGIKDSRTQSKEAILQVLELGDPERSLKCGLDRLVALAQDPDPQIRLRFEQFRFEQTYGKAKESVDVFHRFGAIDEAAEMMGEEGVWQGRDAAHRNDDDADDGRRVQ